MFVGHLDSRTQAEKQRDRKRQLNNLPAALPLTNFGSEEAATGTAVFVGNEDDLTAFRMSMVDMLTPAQSPEGESLRFLDSTTGFPPRGLLVPMGGGNPSSQASASPGPSMAASLSTTEPPMVATAIPLTRRMYINENLSRLVSSSVAPVASTPANNRGGLIVSDLFLYQHPDAAVADRLQEMCTSPVTAVAPEMPTSMYVNAPPPKADGTLRPPSSDVSKLMGEVAKKSRPRLTLKTADSLYGSAHYLKREVTPEEGDEDEVVVEAEEEVEAVEAEEEDQHVPISRWGR